jgi:redox-sensitive bicupin YhaK (pirin superfamily)
LNERFQSNKPGADGAPTKEDPMIELKPFSKLGSADHGWLKAKHHFSFAEYYDPANMSHGALRVWNDDEIAPDTGFPRRPATCR